MEEMVDDERTVGVGVAIIAIFLTLTTVLLSGIYIGQKYFWNKYEVSTRLDIDLSRLEDELKDSPKNPELLVEKGWIFYQQGNLEQAQKLYLQALTVDPNNVGALYNNGLVNFNKKKYQEAESQFLKIEKLYPKHLNNLLILGELYIATKKSDKAIEKLEKLISVKNSWSQAHFFLGQAYELKGLEQKAKASYFEALRFDPQFTLAINRLAELGGETNANTGVKEKENKTQ